MDPIRCDRIIQSIPHDAAVLEEKTRYRDETVRPWIVITLVAVALTAAVFSVVNCIRTFQPLGGAFACALTYTLVMGAATAAFSLLDMCYAFGWCNYLGYIELNEELIQTMRRICTYTYIAPYAYYDDRVLRNTIGIWKMRVLVPILYVTAVVVYWVIEHKSDAALETPSGLQYIFGNVLLAFVGFMHVKIAVSNMYCVINCWDFVPLTLEKKKP